jgi:hypothetical protein
VKDGRKGRSGEKELTDVEKTLRRFIWKEPLERTGVSPGITFSPAELLVVSSAVRVSVHKPSSTPNSR